MICYNGVTVYVHALHAYQLYNKRRMQVFFAKQNEKEKTEKFKLQEKLSFPRIKLRVEAAAF